ncbi:hypothetical protein CBR_g18804 [Chara braunii]|uniref:Reverse transcriptase domain-containing protein n=1 Tax=Chara braunii TaxID=69332 RepID=A0A388KWQ8_CHABU|nr:hypothetical protein CBR_g18804 [Chara braunii]|eukprot:GBG74393.1 hypothetical protein CBR_g18804 [Chara braunii]
MGICNAPATFQRAMNMAFQNFVRKTRLAQNIINYCVIVYMDDILVYSSSYEGHVQHIEWALHALRDAGFKVAFEKCQFFLTTISFLGHVVTDQGLQPEPQKDYSGMIGRWATVLQSMDFDIRHRKHERHGNADRLTRLHRPEKVLKSEEVISWNEPEQEIGPRYGQVEILSKHVSIRGESAGCSIGGGGDGASASGSWNEPRHHGRSLQRRHQYGQSSVAYRDSDFATRVDRAGVQRDVDADQRASACFESLELLIIQAWRTNVEGDLLGFLFGSVRPGHRQLIDQELIVPIVQLADDLSPDIISQSDDSLAPYVLTQPLDPYLQWSACLEESGDEDFLPLRQEYLKPYDIIAHAFYPKAEELVIEEEESDDDEETSEEGSYSEYSEGEQSEEEEEKEETGSE